MIKIVPDKEGRLTQWDLNRKVIVTGYEGVAEVHFASPGDDHGAAELEKMQTEAPAPTPTIEERVGKVEEDAAIIRAILLGEEGEK